MGLQFTHTIADGLVSASYDVETLLCHKTTQLGQRITIFTRAHDGVTMFFLDDEEQSSSDYADAFNSALVPVHADNPLGRVLILGAGAGGPARFALAGGATKITQVDLDHEVCAAADKYLPLWSQGSWNERRVITWYESALEFVADRLWEHEENKSVHTDLFDTIIFDLSESTAAAERTWSRAFFTDLLKLLRPGGQFSTHLTWIGNDPAPKVAELFEGQALLFGHIHSVPAARWHFYHAIKAPPASEVP